MARPPSPPGECANCGAEIPRNARACPECGADERTGWRETSIYDGLDLPDEEGERPARHTGGLAWYWVAAFILVLATVILGVLGLRS
jgi:predicted nucleic acid-binding Zn ribbon protein